MPPIQKDWWCHSEIQFLHGTTLCQRSYHNEMGEEEGGLTLQYLPKIAISVLGGVTL